MSGGAFDTLNDALFAQIDKLQSVDPRDKEQMEQTVAQSQAVSNLARNIIENANTALKTVSYYEQIGMEMRGIVACSPRMLGVSDEVE